jgi:hypothetical protein
MKMLYPIWRAALPITLLVASMSCALGIPGGSASATATPSLSLRDGGGSGGTGGSGGSGGGGTGAGGGSGSSNNGANLPVPKSLPAPEGRGPYVVKQLYSLGRETIAGQVCSRTQAFSVTVNSPHVTFAQNFVPEGPSQGKWTYAYSIPSAGESHDASGGYTLSPTGGDGTLLLAMTGSDHVVFKGFNGNMAISYSFQLVPSDSTSCPAAH